MKARVAFNRPIGENFYRMRLVLPQVVHANPGQFVMVRVTATNDPFLPRPFSIAYNADNRIDIIYVVRGKGTSILARTEAGSEVVVTGPLGNGFTLPEGEKVIFVAGGVGLPPLYFFINKLLEVGYPRKNVFLFYGAQNEDSLLLMDELESMQINLFVSTDDGSQGYHGLITDLFIDEISKIEPQARVYTVGPTLMMAKVVESARTMRFPTEVSLETKMACGIGVCLGCTVKPKDIYFGKLGYLKVCKDGPVFPGEYFF